MSGRGTPTEIETPNERILNREEAKAHAEHYGKALDALQDMVAYGTHLIIRAYNSSEKGNIAVVVIGSLLTQLVAMLDGVELLVREGHGYPALLQMRAAFEASVYIDWILKADSENRACHYLVGNLRDERIWANRGITGTQEKQSFDTVFHPSPVVATELAKIDAEARSHLAEVDSILGRPAFRAIDASFARKKGNKPYDPGWYEVLGLSSFRRVADDVGRLREYELIYGRGSDAMHAGLAKDHIRFVKGGFKFRHIRNLTDAHDALTFSMAQGIHTYRVILDRYRTGEGLAFGQRYLERWQSSLKSMPHIKYKL